MKPLILKDLEKGGIIKPGKPVLIGKLRAEAELVIRQIAQQKNCALYSVRERFPDIGTLPETNLSGSFQQWNAAVAPYATEILNKKFPVDSVKNPSILRKVQWPGRWQSIQLADKTIILDTTHNAEGAEMLKENLEKLVQQTKRKPIIIAGTTGESRARSLVPVISNYARELHLLAPKQPNATPPELLKSYLPSNHSTPVLEQTIEALFPTSHQCTVGESDDTIVITGSIYLIGEVMKRIT